MVGLLIRTDVTVASSAAQLGTGIATVLTVVTVESSEVAIGHAIATVVYLH
jgi:NADH:ubiquinone oxidoreductase subunit K